MSAPAAGGIAAPAAATVLVPSQSGERNAPGKPPPEQFEQREKEVAKPTGIRLFGHALNHAANAVFLWISALVILYGTSTAFYPQFDKTVGVGALPAYTQTMTKVLDFSNVTGVGFLNFQFILVAVALGFPLLMVVSRRTAWSATYISVFLAALTLMWAQLLKGFWANARLSYEHPGSTSIWGAIPLGWDSLLLAVYIAATVQIAYSAVAGRVSFAQAIGLAFFAAFFATANQQIGEQIQIFDSGGSFYIHTFGGVFGVVASRLTYDQTTSEKPSYAEPRSKTAGVNGLIGTALVLAIYPVFNSGLVAYTAYTNLTSAGQSVALGTFQPLIRALVFRAYFNTLFAVASSVAAAYCISKSLSDRGRTVNLAHVQTAAVAGAVAVASYAHALASPWGAMLTGGVAGMVAVWSITGLQPALDKALFFDASATLSAHVIPTLIGAVGSAIAFNRVTADLGYADQQINIILPYSRSALMQGGFQIAYWVITVIFAAVSGALVGLFLNLPIFEAQTAEADTLNDDRDTFDPIGK